MQSLLVLWMAGEERQVLLGTEHVLRQMPGIGRRECPACGMLLEGARIAALAVGPGADPVKQHKHRTGTRYAAVGLAFHAACLGLDPVEQADRDGAPPVSGGPASDG